MPTFFIAYKRFFFFIMGMHPICLSQFRNILLLAVLKGLPN
jgi:hypothetical protein